MSRRREFEIAFVGLKPGIHEFDYTIDDKFFEAFQEQDFRNCKAKVKLELDKKAGFMLLKFELGGQLEVTCDRCNNNLPIELWDLRSYFTVAKEICQSRGVGWSPALSS